MKIFRCFVGLLAIVGFLVSCGGGGGDSAITYTGRYIDAPVKGLSYLASPSGLSGLTDADGKFNFKGGDRVSFNLVTTGGNINVGSTAPATPSSPAVNVPVSVLTLPNGVQIAQILQSLGGTNSSIDVSPVNPNVSALTSSADVLSINKFISTGGYSNVSAAIPELIGANSALSNALGSLVGINAALSASPHALFANNNYYAYLNGGSFYGVGDSNFTTYSGSIGTWSETGASGIAITNNLDITTQVNLSQFDSNGGLYWINSNSSAVGIYRRILKAQEGGFSSGLAIANTSFGIYGGLVALCPNGTNKVKLAFDASGNNFTSYCDDSILSSGIVVSNSYISGLIHLRSTLFGDVLIGATKDSLLDSSNRIVSGAIVGIQIGGSNLSVLLPPGPGIFALKNCYFSCP